MNGFLRSTVANTNEDYKKVIKKRMHTALALAMVGILTIGVAIFTEINHWINVNEDMLKYYIYFGAGLLGCSIALWIKNNRLLADEDKIKRSRIANSDERIREISSRAYHMATVILIITMYIIALFGGLFIPILAKVLMCLISFFVLIYLVCYKILEKNM
jgi:hypothetical protein